MQIHALKDLLRVASMTCTYGLIAHLREKTGRITGLFLKQESPAGSFDPVNIIVLTGSFFPFSAVIITDDQVADTFIVSLNAETL